MRERKDSGRSIRSWCRERGLSEKTYYYWQRKLRKAACEQYEESNAANETGLSLPHFAEVQVQAPLAPTLLEPSSQLLVAVGGVQITACAGYPPDKLAVLLRELTRPC
jgi:hypothetical protein